jgi:hypothetical protein
MGEHVCRLLLRPRNEIPGGLWSWKIYVDGDVHGRGPGSNRKDETPWYASLLAGPHRLVVREPDVKRQERKESNTLHFTVQDQTEIVVDVSYKEGTMLLELSEERRNGHG